MPQLSKIIKVIGFVLLLLLVYQMGRYSTHPLERNVNNEIESEKLARMALSPAQQILSHEKLEAVYNKEYLTLNDVIKDLQYLDLWELVSIELDLFKDWPLEAYNIVNTRTSKIIGVVIFTIANDRYHVIGIDEISLAQLNRKVNVSIGSPAEALNYARNAMELVISLGTVLDSTEGGKVFSPKVINQTDEYYIIEMFLNVIESKRPFISSVKKIVCIITKNGEVAFLDLGLFCD